MPPDRPRLHLDADVSIKALFQALLVLGYDVTRTPNEWMPQDAGDEAQLLGATAHGRVIFTFNVRDFMPLAKRHPHHGGIILAQQGKFALADLISTLDRCLAATQAGDWVGQIRWLSDWRD